MAQDDIAGTLSMMKPEDLYPSWRLIDVLEQHGKMPPEEARRWKEGIFGLMMLWGLEPDDLTKGF